MLLLLRAGPGHAGAWEPSQATRKLSAARRAAPTNVTAPADNTTQRRFLKFFLAPKFEDEEMDDMGGGGGGDDD